MMGIKNRLLKPMGTSGKLWPAIVLGLTFAFWIFVELINLRNPAGEGQQEMIEFAIADIKKLRQEKRVNSDEVKEQNWRSAGICPDDFNIFFGVGYQYEHYSKFYNRFQSLLTDVENNLTARLDQKWWQSSNKKIYQLLLNDEDLKAFYYELMDYSEFCENNYDSFFIGDFLKSFRNEFKLNPGWKQKMTYEVWLSRNFSKTNIYGHIWQIQSCLFTVEKFRNRKNRFIKSHLSHRCGMYFDGWNLTALPKFTYHQIGDTVKKEVFVRYDVVYEEFLDCDVEFSINGSPYETMNSYRSHYILDSFPDPGTHIYEVNARRKIPYSDQYHYFEDKLEFQVIEPTISVESSAGKIIPAYCPTEITLFSGCSTGPYQLSVISGSAQLIEKGAEHYVIRPQEEGRIELYLSGSNMRNRVLVFYAIKPEAPRFYLNEQPLERWSFEELKSIQHLSFDASIYFPEMNFNSISMKISHFSGSHLLEHQANSQRESLYILKKILANLKKGDLIAITDIRLKSADLCQTTFHPRDMVYVF